MEELSTAHFRKEAALHYLKNRISTASLSVVKTHLLLLGVDTKIRSAGASDCKYCKQTLEHGSNFRIIPRKTKRRKKKTGVSTIVNQLTGHRRNTLVFNCAVCRQKNIVLSEKPVAVRKSSEDEYKSNVDADLLSIKKKKKKKDPLAGLKMSVSVKSQLGLLGSNRLTSENATGDVSSKRSRDMLNKLKVLEKKKRNKSGKQELLPVMKKFKKGCSKLADVIAKAGVIKKPEKKKSTFQSSLDLLLM